MAARLLPSARGRWTCGASRQNLAGDQLGTKLISAMSPRYGFLVHSAVLASCLNSTSTYRLGLLSATVTASGSAPVARLSGEPQSAICAGMEPSPAVGGWTWPGGLALGPRD